MNRLTTNLIYNLNTSYCGENKMNELSDYNRGRIETAIDCDGHIYMTKKKRKSVKGGFLFVTHVGVTNTKIKILELLKEITGLGKVKIAAWKKGNRKTSWRWRLEANEQRELLPELELVIKEEQRVLILEALRLLSEHTSCHTPNDAFLEQIYNDLKELHK